MMGRVTRRYTLTGLVQGVGFRPYAAECAERLGITGTIRNRGGAVSLTVTGEEGTLQQLEKQLAACPGGCHWGKGTLLYPIFFVHHSPQ